MAYGTSLLNLRTCKGSGGSNPPSSAKYNMKTTKKGKGKANTRSVYVKRRKEYGNPYSYDPVETWVWRSFSGPQIMDFNEFVNNYKTWEFFIGTDSQCYSRSKICVFTTVLIAHNPYRGGAVIRYTDRRAFVPFEALSSKLIAETQRSIEVCKRLEEKLIELSDENNDYSKNIVGVSIDVNKDNIHASGKYKETLVGMVVGHGYRAFIKPDAWAASSVADSKC